jgi:hypothetical protein
MIRYVIITPARDEEQYLAETAKAICSQSICPSEWIIVNDGSGDATGDIAESYAKQHSWIRVIHRQNRGFRKSGGGVVEAFYAGYDAVQCQDWEFLVKLDADLTFSTTYFEECIQRFAHNSKLGIAGGDIYHNVDGQVKREVNPRFHVRGATKIYRRGCWEQIGGLWSAPGWDTIDEVKASMVGWETRTIPELQVIHHRVTGSAEGSLRDRVKHGVACYISGYHPLFLAASCVARLTRKPYLVGSAAIGYGFIKSYLKDVPRVGDASLVRYLRSQQLRRLCGLETIWK